MWSSVCLISSILFTASEGCTLLGRGTLIQATAYPDGSVLLPCACTDPQDQPSSVRWDSYNHDSQLFTPVTQSHRGRVMLFNGITPSNLSLLLTRITEEDEGDYRCVVNSDNTEYSDVRLTVKGCTLLSDNVSGVKGSPGRSVLLPCACTDLKARPKSLSWEFFTRNLNQWALVTQSDRYRHRVKLFNESTPGNLSLLLSHLTEGDQRFYRCNIKEQGTKDIFITVQETNRPKTSTKGPTTPVKPVTTQKGGNSGGTSEEESYLIIYILVASLSLMMIIAGVSVCIYRRYKDKKSTRETSSVSQSGGAEQKEDDVSVMYDTVAHNGPDARMTAHLTATDDPSVMYSTIVHVQGRDRGRPVVGGEGRTEYASVKTGRAS